MCLCNSRKQIIPVITLRGVISSSGDVSFKKVNKLLKQAFAIPRVVNMAIIINSPGGSPVQSELIYKRIRQLAKENEVNVLTFIEDVGASGGYYIACAGDEIYASNSSIVGSIGVISAGFGFKDLIDKVGVERRVYAQGQNKSILDPFVPQKDEDVQILLDASKDVYDEFVTHVQTCRKNKLNVNDGTLFTGKFWSGKKAKELGLIDGTGDIYSILYEKYGKNIQIKHIQENKGFMSSIKESIGIEMIFKSFFGAAIQSISEYSTSSKYEV